MEIHSDISDLVWFGDGKYKNYISPPNQSKTINLGDVKITYSILSEKEPSLLYLALPISEPHKNQEIERPPYFPTYSDLSLQQRWLYMNFLQNPYDGSHDIGYVFLFYYGLERHLLHGNFEKAFRTILNLRDIYNNSSFQHYSANALILSCMQKQSPDFALEFLNSIDKEYELNVNFNLFLLLKYSFNMPLRSYELIKFHKTIGFTNDRYIKNYKELFTKTLDEVIISRYQNNFIYINQLITPNQFALLNSEELRIFANISIIDKTIAMPNLLSNLKFKSILYDLLSETHEKVKKTLAELRKNGTPLQATPPPVKKKDSPIDVDEEKDLWADYKKEDSVKTSDEYQILFEDSFLTTAEEKYFYLSGIIGKKGSYKRRLEACEESYRLLPEVITSFLNLDGDLPPCINCRDYGPEFYMRLGHFDAAEAAIRKCIAARAYYPDTGKDELKYLKEYKEISNIVLDFLSKNPGYLQKDIYKVFNTKIENTDTLKHFLRFSDQITKEKFKNTNKLYVN